MRKLLAFSLALGFFGCAAQTSTQTARAAAPSAKTVQTTVKERRSRLTAEMVADAKYVRDVAVSPDGKQVAYVVRTPPDPMEGASRGRSVIWVVAAKGGTPRRFSAAHNSSRSPTWSPDGKTLAFLSNRATDDHTSIYLIPRDGGEPSVLETVSSASQISWSSDGKRIAYLASREVTADERKAERSGDDVKIGDAHGTFKRLFVIDVKSEDSSAVTPDDIHVSDFAWSPDGKSFVLKGSDSPYIDTEMMYSRLYTVPSSGGTPKKLVETEGKLGHAAWSPDGKTIAYLGAADIHDPTAGVLFSVPAAGGEAKALTRDYEGTGQSLTWSGNAAIVVLANEGTKTAVLRVTTQGQRKNLASEAPVCRRIHISDNGRTLACSGERSDHPGEVYVGNLGQKLERITFTNPELDGVRLGERKTVRWKAEDGLELEGVLTLPVDYTVGKRYPLAILVHGGPEGISLDGWNTRGTYPVQLFATRGYVVLEPNYRGSQGRGVDFGKADQKDLGGKEFTDVIAGIDHLAAEGIVDPERVGMGGWSYGGYFSGLAATMHSKRFKAAMVGAAITNWVSFTGTTEIEHENSLVHWDLWPWDEIDLAWERSPLAHAKGSTTATLVVHGEEDTRVPPGQAYELYRALRHGGTKTELLLYPREGHGLSERMHMIDFANRFVDWFDAHVKG